MTEALNVKWKRDREAEKEMTRLELEFDWAEGMNPKTDFALKESLANQARTGDVMSDRVSLYAVKLADGVEFPGIIVRRNGAGGKYIVVGGNHRRAAAEQLGVPISGYVLADLEIPAATLLDLTFWDNGRHGAPPTRVELRHQAIQYADLGFTQKEAAARTGLKLYEVQQAMRDINATRLARKCGLDMNGWDKIPLSSQRDLAGIKTQQGFTALAELVIKANLTTKEVAEHVTEMNVDNDADAQVEYVKKLKADYALRLKQRRGLTDKRGAKSMTPRTVFVGSGRTIMGLSPAAVANHYDGRVDRDAAATEIDLLIKHLQEIKKALI